MKYARSDFPKTIICASSKSAVKRPIISETLSQENKISIVLTAIAVSTVGKKISKVFAIGQTFSFGISV